MTEKLLTGMLGPNPNKHTSFSGNLKLNCAFVFANAKSMLLFVLASQRAVGGRTGLMVRASDFGSGDPGSILGRVGVFVSLSKRHLLPKKYW